MGKVILWELCKKLNFDDNTKCYMHKQESVQENETHEILWDFEIQTSHTILTRRPDLFLIIKKEKNRQLGDFTVSSKQQSVNKGKRKSGQLPGPCLSWRNN